jgi:uncharacterized protein
MDTGDDTCLKITDDLLMLEKGGEEFLLTDYVDLRPLYIRKGKRYISNFLKAIPELKTRKRIVEAFPQDAALLDTLLDHGIVVPDSFTRNKVKNYSPEALDLNHRPKMSLYLLVSQSCNLGCTYCLNGRSTYQTDKALKMEKAVAFKSVDRCIDEISLGGRLEVVFFGGEPLLNWPLVKDTIMYCEESVKTRHPDKEIHFHITSNLSMLPADLVEWAQRYNITFLCDIDGPPAIHNACRPYKDGRPSHDRIVDNIKHLIDAGLKVDLRATITAHNQNQLVQVAEHHKAIGGNSSAFIPVNPVNSDEDILNGELLPSPRKMAKSLIKVYRSGVWKCEELFPFNLYAQRLRPGTMTVLGCGLPFGNTPVVGASGDVFPCIYLVGIKRYFIGNMMDGTYPNKELLKRLYTQLHVDHMEKCGDCSWRYMCGGGGCPLWRLTVLDNPAVTQSTIDYCSEAACGYTKTLMEALLWDKARKSATQLTESLLNNHSESTPNPTHC